MLEAPGERGRWLVAMSRHVGSLEDKRVAVPARGRVTFTRDWFPNGGLTMSWWIWLLAAGGILFFLFGGFGQNLTTT